MAVQHNRHKPDGQDERKKRCIRLLSVTILSAVGLTCAFLLLLPLGEKSGGLCPFRRLFGLSCPGCGTTRALLACLRLDVCGALRYNLLLPVELGYLVWVYAVTALTYLRTGRISYEPRRPAADLAVLTAVLVWWVVRNLLGI